MRRSGHWLGERLPGHQTNMREKRIHIFGGPGSGTTTLGNKLGQTLQIAVFDSDTYYWENSAIAFTIKREVIKRNAMLASELSKHKNWIVSGSIMSWKIDIPQQFTHAVFLYLETETRIARLHSREVARYGAEAVAPGGKRHQLATEFLAWAAHYDDGTLSGRSLPLHEAWMKTLHCPILRLNSQPPISVLIHDALAFIRD